MVLEESVFFLSETVKIFLNKVIVAFKIFVDGPSLEAFTFFFLMLRLLARAHCKMNSGDISEVQEGACNSLKVLLFGRFFSYSFKETVFSMLYA